MPTEALAKSRLTNPLFNDNRLKLGLFGTNVSNGCAPSLAEGGLEVAWPITQRLNVAADRAGFEALVPIGRFKGAGGLTDWNGTSFESYTWAAGLAAVTSHAAVLSTSHVYYTHPVMAAKQAVTIDHISGGRFALNVVGSGSPYELAMFGQPSAERDDRYEYSAEWIELLERLWTSDEPFDFAGQYFTSTGAISKPQPIQRPFPPIMNAAQSPRGQRFAAQYADMIFFILQSHEYESGRAQINAFKSMAAKQFGRHPQAWLHAYVVCRPTEAEARAWLDYYVNQKGDWAAIDTLINDLAPQVSVLPAPVLEHLRFHFCAGFGGYPLVGTPEQVVEDLVGLADAGVDGLLIHWQDYDAGLDFWVPEVMPLLVEAGLRKPFQPPVGDS